MKTRISYYQRNFLECQRNPDIQPEWCFAIWNADSMFHTASFETEAQLKQFAEMLGFSYEWTEERNDGYKEGFCSHLIIGHAKDDEPCNKWHHYFNLAYHSESDSDRKKGRVWLDRHFRDIQQAFSITKKNLEHAKKFKCLSNGSIVDGYFTNDGDTIKIYRCNPNAKDFYNPLPLEEHINYQRNHGVY